VNVVIDTHPDGATFCVRAQPGGRRNAVRGEHDGCLKLSVTQVAEKGKANDAILAVLCDTLSLSRNQIELISGVADRRKRFLVRGVDIDELKQKLTRALDEAASA